MYFFVYLVCFYPLDHELFNYNFFVAFASRNFKITCSSPLVTSTETMQWYPVGSSHPWLHHDFFPFPCSHYLLSLLVFFSNYRMWDNQINFNLSVCLFVSVHGFYSAMSLSNKNTLNLFANLPLPQERLQVSLFWRGEACNLLYIYIKSFLYSFILVFL